MYIDRNIKGAYRFPSCKRCNESSKESDQIAALSACIMGSATSSHLPQNYVEKLIQGVANNSPEFFGYFGSNDKSIWLNVNGLLREQYRVEIDNEVRVKWLDPWAVKQALAFWYHHTNSILPEKGRVFVHWIFNEGLEGHDKFLKKATEMMPNLQFNQQGMHGNSDQYFYRVGIDFKKRIGSFLFGYHQSAHVWCIVFENGSDELLSKGLPIYMTSKENGIELFLQPIPKK